jgi:hypothetical protein
MRRRAADAFVGFRVGGQVGFYIHERRGSTTDAKTRRCINFGNWITRQDEQEGESRDAHCRFTLDSSCSRGAVVKAATWW